MFARVVSFPAGFVARRSQFRCVAGEIISDVVSKYMSPHLKRIMVFLITISLLLGRFRNTSPNAGYHLF